jgi:phage gp45-like
MELRHGRTLSLLADGADEVVELRDGAGRLELRLKLTEDGVVLQLEGARISLRAEQSIDLESREITLKAATDLRINGERVYIN